MVNADHFAKCVSQIALLEAPKSQCCVSSGSVTGRKRQTRRAVAASEREEIVGGP